MKASYEWFLLTPGTDEGDGGRLEKIGRRKDVKTKVQEGDLSLESILVGLTDNDEYVLCLAADLHNWILTGNDPEPNRLKIRDLEGTTDEVWGDQMLEAVGTEYGYEGPCIQEFLERVAEARSEADRSKRNVSRLLRDHKKKAAQESQSSHESGEPAQRDEATVAEQQESETDVGVLVPVDEDWETLLSDAEPPATAPQPAQRAGPAREPQQIPNLERRGERRSPLVIVVIVFLFGATVVGMAALTVMFLLGDKNHKTVLDEVAQIRNELSGLQGTANRLEEEIQRTGSPQQDSGVPMTGLKSQIDKIQNQVTSLQIEVRQAMENRSQDDAARAAKWEKSIAEQVETMQGSVSQLKKGWTGLQKSTEELGGRVGRVADALEVPPDEDLSSVLFLVDLGERMSAYGYPAVQQALLLAVENSLRKSPGRKIGVVANRGNRLFQLLTPDVHFVVPDLETFRQQLTKMRPDVGEESDWLEGIQGAVDLLASRGDAWRLVYVTHSPLREPEPNMEQWSRAGGLIAKYGIELWVVQLVRQDDVPSKDLVRLTTVSGGKYVALAAGDKPDDLPQGYAYPDRLASALQQSLDLFAATKR